MVAIQDRSERTDRRIKAGTQAKRPHWNADANTTASIDVTASEPISFGTTAAMAISPSHTHQSVHGGRRNSGDDPEEFVTAGPRPDP